jgi:tRNA(Ile)-lysidine synthase TilS/MesJ
MTTDRGQQLGRCQGRLLGKLRRTARRWPVVPEGVRLGLAISGGLDSLAMAYLVTEHNRRLKKPMDLMALHVRVDGNGETSGLPDAIMEWLDLRGLELFEVVPRLDISETERLDCFSCARIRRRSLLETADARGASHVALGHHADDVVETWLMSLMFSGTAETIPPVRSYFGGAVTVVRPLYELKKQEIVRLARLADLPEAVSPCTMERDARRGKIRKVLGALGRDQALVRRQLYWAAARGLEQTDSDAGRG